MGGGYAGKDLKDHSLQHQLLVISLNVFVDPANNIPINQSDLRDKFAVCVKFTKFYLSNNVHFLLKTSYITHHGSLMGK